LTVLLVAVLNISGVSLSAPGSRFSTASRAEASSTILFIASRLAPFGNQLVDEGRTSLHMRPDKALSSLDAAFQRRDPQFVILHAQDNFVADIDSQRLAKRGWYDDTAVLIDTLPGFRIHCHSVLHMTSS
jgi:hypothetical protein